MRKRRVQFLIILLILLVGSLVSLAVCVKVNTILGIKEITEEKLHELTLEKIECDVLGDRLLINGESPAYDTTYKIFYIPQSLEGKSLYGSLSLREKKPSEKLYFVASQKDKKTSIADNEHFQICYIDKEKSVYQIAEIVFSGLPVMSINKNEMSLFSAKKNNVIIDKSEIMYEQRGASTRYYDKKSYNLKLLNEKKSLAGLRTDDDWILNALYDDIGLIHNQLSYELWNEIASLEACKGNYSVNQEYIELVLDGEYLGVYALSERGDTKQFMMSDADILFKVRGYPYDEGRGVIDLKYPKESTPETDSLKNSFMEHFCEDNDIPVENSLILIDYENSLDYSLFCQIATALDNTIKNSFLVGRRTGEYYKLCEIPWDCNMTWGIKNYILTNEESIYDTEFMSLVIRKLYKKNPEKINLDMANRWFYLRESVLSEDNIKSVLDENFSVLHDSGAYERNYQKWPTVSVSTGEKSGSSGVSFSDIGDGQSRMTAYVSEIWDDESIYWFVEKRLEVLDDYYGQFLDDAE